MGIFIGIALNLIRIYQIIIFVRAIMSWFPDVASSSIGQFLYSITEPVYAPIRQIIQKSFNLNIPIDFTPIVIYFGLEIISTILRIYYI